MYIYLLDFLEVCKCKVLFSVNNCALTKYKYRNFIKEKYDKIYQTHLNTTNTTNKKKHTNFLILSNF